MKGAERTGHPRNRSPRLEAEEAKRGGRLSRFGRLSREAGSEEERAASTDFPFLRRVDNDQVANSGYEARGVFGGNVAW